MTSKMQRECYIVSGGISLNLLSYGIVFFGTPHQGGNLVALGKLLSWTIRRVTPGNASNNLLNALERDGFFTDELREDFRQQLEDYHLISYFEEDNTRIMGKDIGKVINIDHESVLN